MREISRLTSSLLRWHTQLSTVSRPRLCLRWESSLPALLIRYWNSQERQIEKVWVSFRENSHGTWLWSCSFWMKMETWLTRSFWLLSLPSRTLACLKYQWKVIRLWCQRPRATTSMCITYQSLQLSTSSQESRAVQSSMLQQRKRGSLQRVYLSVWTSLRMFVACRLLARWT